MCSTTFAGDSVSWAAGIRTNRKIMSFVAISFPVSNGPVTQRKNESLRRAKKFAASINAADALDLAVIREGVYGYVVPSDVDDLVLSAASKHGAKILPFTESEEAPVEEGKWITLESAAMGVRFNMRGTTPTDPVEGKILPGKYFVLGLQESNGGKYATLGRVDRLAEIGRSTGPGRYTYNVDINLLREALAKAEVKTESQKSTKAAKVEAQDRTDEILEMLLENDPHLLAYNKREAAKAAGGAVNEEPTLEQLVEESMNGSSSTEVDTSAFENEVGTVEAPAASTEETTELVESETTETEATEPAKEAESEDEDEEGYDPELFAECRAAMAALEEAGFDVDTMTEAELDEALSALYAEGDSGEESGEDVTEEKAEDAEKSEDAPAEETAEDKTEAAAEPDDAFEAAPAAEDEQK